jgi:hypothetical protein
MLISHGLTQDSGDKSHWQNKLSSNLFEQGFV